MLWRLSFQLAQYFLCSFVANLTLQVSENQFDDTRFIIEHIRMWTTILFAFKFWREKMVACSLDSLSLSYSKMHCKMCRNQFNSVLDPKSTLYLPKPQLLYAHPWQLKVHLLNNQSVFSEQNQWTAGVCPSSSTHGDDVFQYLREDYCNVALRISFLRPSSPSAHWGSPSQPNSWWGNVYRLPGKKKPVNRPYGDSIICLSGRNRISKVVIGAKFCMKQDSRN